MQIDHLDHLVLTVQDIQTTCEFYSRVLGMQVVTFAEGRKALQFGNQKINLHQKGKEFDPKAQYPTPGSADLCFLTSIPLEQVSLLPPLDEQTSRSACGWAAIPPLRGRMREPGRTSGCRRTRPRW